MGKKFFVGGNWKCNGNNLMGSVLVKMLNNCGEIPECTEVVIAPPMLYMGPVMENLRPDIKMAAQNVAKHPKPGAYTGEVVGETLKDFGVDWVITGHSERRANQGETSAIVAKKSQVALAAGLKVIFCCGETLQDRQRNNTLNVVLNQHLLGLKAAVRRSDWEANNIVIAYEPVWAIGTGLSATPQQAQDVHLAIRQWLSDKLSPKIAAQTRIIYGGSVNGKNCGTLIQCPDIDGFLVGGAALKPEFADIIRCAQPPGYTLGGPKPAHKLVLIRHGESQWNQENRFTGWYDVSLAEKGMQEAQEAGRLLKEGGFQFDLAYTSVLKRAIKTCMTVLRGLDLMWIPVTKHWRLNERHYGALQGLNKQETVDKHGIDQVNIWRRSYDIPPPALTKASEYWPGHDRRYKGLTDAEIPMTESLKLTEARFGVYWDETIAPAIRSGKRVIIAAHGNSLRALVKKLDNISEKEITGLNIPTGVPLVYDLDASLNPIKHPDAIGPLSGAYLGDQAAIRARIEGVKNQTKG